MPPSRVEGADVPPTPIDGSALHLPPGSTLARWLLGLARWRVDFDGTLPRAQGVLIVYPHTSNWDFVVGILAKWALGLPASFWGKASLFKVPLLGRWLRSVGGIPIDRSTSQGAVGAMVQNLVDARRDGRTLWLALSPEGTRGYRDAWRSGFYQVALQAGVPLGLAYLDYAERRVGIAGFVWLSGERERDMIAIAEHLAHRVGRHPAQAAPVRLSS